MNPFQFRFWILAWGRWGDTGRTLDFYSEGVYHRLFFGLWIKQKAIKS